MIDFFSLRRANYPEVVVRGDAQFVPENGEPLNFGNATRRLPVRSLLKPMQWLATCPDVKDSRWLVGASSHSGQLIHTNILSELAMSKGIEWRDLCCPPAMPMDAAAAAARMVANEAAQVIYHPCAAKHLMYRIFEGQGDYRLQTSKAHRRLVKILQELGIQKQEWLTDSCGLPTLVCEMSIFLDALLRMHKSASAHDLYGYWRERPEMVGGMGRLDTWICQVSNGSLLAKEGADGLLSVWSSNGNVRTGTMIKLDSGYNATYLAASLYAVLERSDAAGPWLTLRQPLHERVRSSLPKDQSFEIGL